MPLKGKVPSHVQKRLKLLMFGVAGSGKTMAALNFPKPYLIDTEKGAENDQYIALLEAQGGAIFQTSDFDEVYKEVVVLAYEKHEYKTLIIDPITVIYNKLLEDAEEKVGSAHGRHYGVANAKMKSLINHLMRLDMNVVITAHAKKEYGEGLIVLDQTFDAWKKLDHIFDLVLEIRYAKPDRLAIVRKTRIDAFPLDDRFAFSYEEIKKRYGGDLLEKECEAVEPAKKEDVERLAQLIIENRTPEDLQKKWLERAGAENLYELNAKQVGALLEMLEKKTQ